MTDKLNTTTQNNNDNNPVTLIKYQWETEANACKKCQEMNGKYFDSLEDFEKARPHPHCKCKPNAIFSLGIQKDEENVDILYDKNFNNNEISNFEKIKKINELKNEIMELQHQIKTFITILNEDIEKLNTIIKDPIHYSSLQKEETLKEKSNLIKLKQKYIDLNNYLISQMEETRSNPTEKKLCWLAALIIKIFMLIYGLWHSHNFKQPKAYNLFLFASAPPNKRPILKKIFQNVSIHEKIEEIPDVNIQNEIKNRIILENVNPNGIQVVEFHPNSSIVKAIKNSQNFKNFLAEKQSEINIYGQISDTKIEFTNIDPDMYAAFHGAELKNIHLDKNGNLHVRLEDLYNFNKGRTSNKGRAARIMQENGHLAPYYIICHIIVTKNEMLR